jgi:hypothetical protein
MICFVASAPVALSIEISFLSVSHTNPPNDSDSVLIESNKLGLSINANASVDIPKILGFELGPAAKDK